MPIASYDELESIVQHKNRPGRTRKQTPFVIFSYVFVSFHKLSLLVRPSHIFSYTLISCPYLQTYPLPALQTYPVLISRHIFYLLFKHIFYLLFRQCFYSAPQTYLLICSLWVCERCVTLGDHVDTQVYKTQL